MILKIIRILSMFTICLLWTGCREPSAEEPGSKMLRLGKNQVLNGGLESVVDGTPEHWEAFTFGGSPPGEHSLDFDPHTRNHTLMVNLPELGAAGWRQKVQLEPDTLWMMNCKVKTDSVAGNGMGAAMFFPIFRYMEPPSVRQASEWTSISAELVNAGFVEMDLTCSLGPYGGNTGKAWFDEIAIVPQIDPAQNPKTTRDALWGPFAIRYNAERGYLTSLRTVNRKESNLPEFLGSYPTLAHLDHAKDHFLGDIAVDVLQTDTWQHLTTADALVTHAVDASAAGLKTVHRFPSAEKAPEITTDWTLQDNILVYTITISNRTGEPMAIGSIDLPFAWNNNYCLFNPHDKNSQRLLYTRRVAEHKHIGGLSSYILASPMDGVPPYLLVTPGNADSGFEFAYHSPETIKSQVRDTHRWIHGAWPGLTRVCFRSAGVIARYNWSDWFNGHTQLDLGPEETRSFTLHFQWIEHRSEVEAAVAKSGGLGIRLEPGPAVPIGELVTVRAYGAVLPVTVEGSGIEQVSNGSTEPGSAETRIGFLMKEPGEQVVTVRDGNGKTARLIMMGLAPITDLLTQRTHFISNHQVYQNPGHPLQNGILCWNNRSGEVLAETRDMWGSGGYEGGVTDAQFMAMKNLIIPDAAEIKLLESYIHEWLIGKLQNSESFGVAWMVAEPSRIERGYNYIHVLNLYDAMARSAAVWPTLFQYDPPHYLDLWIRTFRAYNSRSVNFRDLGLMGRGNITNMPEFFRRWGLEQDATEIESEISRWAEYWSQEPAYPYGSELFFDNTGYETVAMYCDYDLRINPTLTQDQKLARTKLVEQTISVTEAGRGRAPTWFWNDSDQRWWDAVRTQPEYRSFTDFGENCHHYMTGLNGYMLLELFDRGYNRDESSPTGFSGILAHLGRIAPDGFAGMCYCPDPSSDNRGMNQFTGDVGLGLWGGLLGLRCYVLNDDPSGLRCLGGRPDTTVPGAVTIHPWPGCDHRLRWMVDGEVFFDTDGLKIRSATRSTEGRRWTVVLENPAQVRSRSRLVVRGLAPGSWSVTWDVNKGRSLDSSRVEVDSSPVMFERLTDPGTNLVVTLALEANR